MLERSGGKRMRRGITRRGFLAAGGSVAAGTYLLAGCDALSTQPEQQRDGSGNGGAEGARGKEAPELAELVKNGELPPVEERLPENPVVIEPAQQAGLYGGTWRTALLGPADTPWLGKTVGSEALLRWNFDLTEVIPNVVEEFEANEDATEFTFRLRKGMRWSDGEPFTADDIVFAQNDVLNNTDLYPEPPWSSTAEKVDDQTVKLVFEEPDGLFLKFQALDESLVRHPRHYLEQFHKEYNPDVDELVKEEGAPDWVDLFFSKADQWGNAELPRLHGWRVVQPLGAGNRVTFERNPYFWKVDSEGRQLPYIDKVNFDVVQDDEVILLKTLNGEIDFHARHINTLQNKPVIARNREDGDYRFVNMKPDVMNTMVVVFNLTHKDETKREVYQNRDFRIGLSYAMNRPEIINVVYQEQGEPYQAAPRPEAELYDEEFAKQYTEYDVDRANEHLDRAGYSERSDDGIRLGPDGEPISVTIEFSTGIFPEYSDVLELVQGHWREVGIDVNLKSESRELFLERNQGNDSDTIVWWGDGGLTPVMTPDWYFPDPAYLVFAQPWTEWYGTEGESGQRPPEPARRQMEIYDRIKATADPEEQNRLMAEVLDIAKEQFWVMGVNLHPPIYGIAKNDLRNIPEDMLQTAQASSPALYHTTQFFFEDGGTA
jgi:peptide/nickel transport system substrate-binding protein